MAEEAFRMFTVDAPRTFRTMAKRLRERKEELLRSLIAVQNWDHHQRMVGTINGIEEAIQMLDDVEKQERN